MQGAWSLSRSQRPFWKKARCHPVGLAAGPCAEEKQTYLTCETPPPSRLFASNVNENRLGSSHDSIFAHAARPRRTLPFPSADRSALSRDSSSPWVPPGAGPFGFSQGSCLQVSTEISSKNLGCILVGLIRLISGVCRYFQKPYRLFFLWAWI